MHIWGKDIFVNALASCFESLRFEVIRPEITGLTRRFFRPDDIVLFIDMASVQALMAKARHRGCFVAHYNMEPCDCRSHYSEEFQSRFRGYMHRLVKCEFDAIFDYNGNTTSLLQKMGVKAYLLPMGYHESYEVEPAEPFDCGAHWLGLEFHPSPKKAKKDPIRRDRRGWICQHIRYADVCCFSHNFRKERGTDGMRRLLSTPGVHLNLHRPEPPFQFGGIRVISYLMSNRRFVLSEPCVWYPEGLRSGVHWEVVNTRNLVKRVVYWLQRPKAREEMARVGYEFIRKHHRLDEMLQQALAEAGLLYG